MLARPERPSDFAAIDAVHELAFARSAEARLVRALRNDPAYLGGLAFVGVMGQQVVGHLLLSRIDICNGREIPALALAPVAVLPAWQGRGCGSLLIRHGLDAARQSGHRLVVVLGHGDYYPRFGFIPAQPAIAAPFAVDAASWMICPLVPGALEDVHGTVRYPAPFLNVQT